MNKEYLNERFKKLQADFEKAVYEYHQTLGALNEVKSLMAHNEKDAEVEIVSE